MTNQECNQVYWTLGEPYRDALDCLIHAGRKESACRLLIEQAAIQLDPPRRITVPEAVEWYEWRKSLRQMQGRD